MHIAGFVLVWVSMDCLALIMRSSVGDTLHIHKSWLIKVSMNSLMVKKPYFIQTLGWKVLQEVLGDRRLASTCGTYINFKICDWI